MNTLKMIVTAAAATGLVATPALAQSVSAERTSSPTRDAERLEGENGILIALLAAAAVIAGIVILASDSDDEDDLPASP